MNTIVTNHMLIGYQYRGDGTANFVLQAVLENFNTGEVCVVYEVVDPGGWIKSTEKYAPRMEKVLLEPLHWDWKEFPENTQQGGKIT